MHTPTTRVKWIALCAFPVNHGHCKTQSLKVSLTALYMVSLTECQHSQEPCSQHFTAPASDLCLSHTPRRRYILQVWSPQTQMFHPRNMQKLSICNWDSHTTVVGHISDETRSAGHLDSRDVYWYITMTSWMVELSGRECLTALECLWVH